MREVLGKDHPENVRATMLTTAFISAAANLRPLPWDGILRYRTQVSVLRAADIRFQCIGLMTRMLHTGQEALVNILYL